MKNYIIIPLILFLSSQGIAQEMNVGFAIQGNYMKPIFKEQLKDVKTISDINPGYPASWIDSYVSSEIIATNDQYVLKSVSKNDTLTSEQIDNLASLDVGSKIEVLVQYHKSNSANSDEVRKINFSYTVVPTIEAAFPGGIDVLNAYLKENALDRVSEKLADKLKLATVIFKISKEGDVLDAHVAQTSEHDDIDKLLLEVINNMPKWTPAENSDGTKAVQEFKFDIGYMIGC